MASDSHDAAHEAIMGGLIRRGLSSSANGAEHCPDPEIVAAYYDRSLDANESAQFETHLSSCARCREQIAAMVRVDQQAAPAARRLWFRDWRLISAAVAALLVLTVWGVERSSAPAPQANLNQPLVAMSRPTQAPPLQPEASAPNAEQQSTPRTKTFTAPRSLDRATRQPGRKPGEEASQGTNQTLEKPPLRLETPPKNARSFGALNQTVPNATDQADGVPELKKQSTNEMAAAAVAPPASSRSANPMSASASPSDSLSNAPSAKAAERMQQPGSTAPESGAVLGGASAQATEQRTGSTIIQTPDSKIVWRIVSGRFVERTEDGGATWHGEVPASDVQLTAGAAPSSKTCWLVGRSGAIVVTKDASHWKKIPPPIPADFVAIAATSDAAATITAADGQKFATHNQGKTWVPVK